MERSEMDGTRNIERRVYIYIFGIDYQTVEQRNTKISNEWRA